MTIISILFAILVFCIVITLHELGHFTAAKLFKIQVNEFSLFMGPAIFKKKKGDTLYAIRCIPIGGYCALEGEDTDTDNPRSFQKAAWWKRLIVLVAGSFMNLITGFVLLLIVYAFAQWHPVPAIYEAEPGCTVVREDGLHVGDRFVEINGYDVYTTSDALMLFSFGGETFDLVVERNGQQVVLDDFYMEKHPFINEQTGLEEMRYGFEFGAEEATVANLVPFTWDNSRSVVQSVWLGLKMLITGQASFKDMMGPVGLVQVMSEATSESESIGAAILNMCYFGGFIAINLGIMNMLPIPALDGGRSVSLLLTTAIEKITRKKLNPKYEGIIHGVGMILLLVLMAVIMFKDIFFIFKG